MKTKIRLIILTTVLIIGTLISCKTQQVEVDTVSHATQKGSGWKIELIGARNSTIYLSSFQDWECNSPSDFTIKEFESKGKEHTYKVINISNLVGQVDDANKNTFNELLWNNGFELIFESSDGYSIGIDTSTINYNDMFIAYEKDGVAISPSVVGNLSSQQCIKDLSKIYLKIANVDLSNNNFRLGLSIGSIEKSFTIDELLNSDFYYESKGQFINSYGNSFQYTWGGIKLLNLLNEYCTFSEDNLLTIISMDGYEMDYNADQILNESDGYWLLAIKENGEFMPEDPGYIRLVKVGPQNPMIDGHCSAKMVERIIISKGSFTDFSIDIISGDSKESMDRQEVQSGVFANKSKVNYYNKKTNSVITYLGIPLYDFFKRYNNYKTVTIEANDGYSITLNRSDIENNKDVIVAMFYGDGSEFDSSIAPLIIAWDKDTKLVPEGIKAVKCISKFILN